jgi:hypothetical protein
LTVAGAAPHSVHIASVTAFAAAVPSMRMSTHDLASGGSEAPAQCLDLGGLARAVEADDGDKASRVCRVVQEHRLDADRLDARCGHELKG